jgi:hypothetical protein
MVGVLLLVAIFGYETRDRDLREFEVLPRTELTSQLS